MKAFLALAKIINQVQPDEIYHLAAQSYVSNSFEDEFSTLNTNINGTHFMLASKKNFLHNQDFILQGHQKCLVKLSETPQNETGNFTPDLPMVFQK